MVTAMKMTVGTLNDLRDEDRFQALFEAAVMHGCVAKVTFHSQNYHVSDVNDAHPSDSMDQRQHSWTTAEEYFRSQFFQLVDTAVSQLKLRYDQPLHQYMQLENDLIAADTSTDHLKTVTSPYPKMGADRR